MKKNGFIATSILYSFFLVFITLFVALITNYLHNQVLLSAVDDKARETLEGINNTKFTDLEIGDHVRFANNPTAAANTSGTFALNDKASWVIADIIDIGGKKKYYLLSDFTAQNPVITRKMGTEVVPFRHTVTIDVMNFLSLGENNDGYRNDIYFYNQGVANGIFTKNDFNIYIPRASVLNKIRKSDISDDIKDAILGPNGDYAVYIDDYGYGGFDKGDYALLRRYNFSMKELQETIYPEYCKSNYNADTNQVIYTDSNSDSSRGFGYTHVNRTSINTTSGGKAYVDYCNYASRMPYNHSRAQQVVTQDEVNKSDLITTTYSAITYQYRLMADITVDESSDFIYVSGGRGTSIDPYLMTDGVKPQ